MKGLEIGGFTNAVSITADGIGSIYVLDAGANEIVKLDSNLAEMKRAGRTRRGKRAVLFPDIYRCFFRA